MVLRNWLLTLLPRDGCVADNQNGVLHRSNHKRASYPRFMLVSETECGDWLIIFVANPELGKAAFGWVHFHWCKSVSHLAAFRRSTARQNTRARRGGAIDINNVSDTSWTIIWCDASPATKLSTTSVTVSPPLMLSSSLCWDNVDMYHIVAAALVDLAAFDYFYLDGKCLHSVQAVANSLLHFLP
jgi:hypothetical protein